MTFLWLEFSFHHPFLQFRLASKLGDDALFTHYEQILNDAIDTSFNQIKNEKKQAEILEKQQQEHALEVQRENNMLSIVYAMLLAIPGFAIGCKIHGKIGGMVGAVVGALFGILLRCLIFWIVLILVSIEWFEVIYRIVL